MKDSQRAHPPAPATPFLSSIRSGALLSPAQNLGLMHKILSFCSLMHSQGITHVHAHKHITPTQSAAQRQDTCTHPPLFLPLGLRTTAILHHPFRNLLRLLFQWFRPEALVLQSRHIFSMIKCSICSYIS